ncbi:AraC family transcriptional regulator [Streptomyces sp. NBC_00873]|uniref:AraC family transcriptional regulator n=1 Tax=unclassified Streptomyces TaxID=2593676 RepID=UPI00386DE209|nr:AraC family transcriptional regulator [Streptomyces sp. NBC_00873]WSY96833.1 AraC family transcriptional regulator [Streptomyces sp. NBC_00873]WTA41394.1 AraC family transcriptional regulator [Streptomyces sp. NBC_00842]WTA48503.1 AraC family transcriptional regulator [Streptomyces sp. NBC_00842]
MDVLSDVVAVTRTGRSRSAHVRWHAPWRQEFASVPGSAGFQVVLQGSCWLLPPEAQPVQLGAGDVVFLPHGSGHTLADSPETPVTAPACGPDDHQLSGTYASDSVDRSGDDGPVTVVLCGAYQLDPSRTHPLLLTLPQLIHLPTQAVRHPQLSSAVELLAAEVENPRLGTDAAVPALLDALLLYILRIWFNGQSSLGNTTGWAAALNDPPVTAALHAIHRDPASPWTVAKLAAEAGLSRAPFARRFALLIGQPPLGYLTWWRMTTAARLLRTSDAPLRSIAAQVGYTSEFAFANAFKRTHGTAPGTYRRRS